MISNIYINRLGLYFETEAQLIDYVTHHYNIFTKQELANIIVELLDTRD